MFSVRSTSVIFLGLLLYSHGAGEFASLISSPMSLLRDGDQQLIGFSLFGSMLVIGILMVCDLVRFHRLLEAVFFVLATIIIGFIAVTPSDNADHLFLSLALLLSFFLYYARQLRTVGSIWFYAHLFISFAWVAVIENHSFGLWQKGMIVYLIILVNIHNWLLKSGRLECQDLGLGITVSRTNLPLKRKVVFAVAPGKSWTRRHV